MSHPPPLPTPLYIGSANSWECDDGGHLNVRFHMERALTGLAHMARALHMPRAFTPSAGATLIPLDIHVRFLKEARPPAPLIMHGGIVRFDACEALICVDMRHSDGAPASAFTVRAAHADPHSLKPFPWSMRTCAAADAHKCGLPAHAAPRSIDVARPPPQAGLARATQLGGARIGAALVQPDQCDAFGRLRAEHFVGRVSDSAPNLLMDWRVGLAAEAGRTKVAPAGAVVEGRMAIAAWPRAGDLIEIHSAITEVGEKTLRLCHWLLDPESELAWATFEVIALTFDAITRKALAPSPDLRARMQTQVIADFAV